MKYVLITLSGGIIDQVTFYDDPYIAVGNLAKYVMDMNPEKNDAVVYGPGGIVANAKNFMDENDQFIHGAAVIDSNDEQIYVIADPCYNLVFFAKGQHNKPFEFADNFRAVTILERMRKDHGVHIKLYRIEPVNSPVASKTQLEQYHKDRDIKDFQYSLIEEYLK
jgi:hypothetical protein